MSGILKTTLATAETTGFDLAIVGAFAGEKPDDAALPDELARAVRKAVERPGWKAKKGHRATGSAGDTPIWVLGLGKRSELDVGGSLEWLHESLSLAAREGFRRPLLAIPGHETTRGSEAALRVLRELAIAGYAFDRFRDEPTSPRLGSLRVLPPSDEEGSYRRALRLARPLTAAVAWARDLANTPPNEATPAWMAEQAGELAGERGMEIEVLDSETLRERGMGGLLAVGGGSANPPRLVRLAWGSGERTVALVGKGVTFDSGGISIKPSADMDEMKFDKAGACSALGFARGAAELELPYRFEVYVPLAENMPGGSAYRPGDIVRCYGGKTVEILNTDAEGRMILADALAWAAEGEPDVLIDLATLTGACVVALGNHGAGLFTPDDVLAEQLLTASDSAWERLWRQPLWPEFGKEMLGKHGDLQNSGSRWGGASTAAAFLSNFVGGAGSWAHLDIAGPAYVGRSGKGDYGATGYGVGLLLTWLLTRAGRL